MLEEVERMNCVDQESRVLPVLASGLDGFRQENKPKCPSTCAVVNLMKLGVGGAKSFFRLLNLRV